MLMTWFALCAKGELHTLYHKEVNKVERTLDHRLMFNVVS